MITIHKYQFNLVNEHLVIPMSEGAEIIHFSIQDTSPTLWAVVDETAERVDRHFWVIGSGQGLPPGMSAKNHIGTIQLGSYAWHLFE